MNPNNINMDNLLLDGNVLDPKAAKLDGTKITSLNCNGLGDNDKKTRCRTVLKAFDVQLLQETHSTPDTEFDFRRYLGKPNMAWSHDSSSKRGVAIALGNAWGDLDQVKADKEGRIVTGITNKDGIQVGMVWYQRMHLTTQTMRRQ